MHTDNEVLLQTQINNEVKFRGVAVSAEAESREDADAFLQAQVGGLWGGLQTIEAESKTRDSALDTTLTVERTRALDAEAVVQANVEAEAKERASEVKIIDGRVDLLHSSQNGQGYASRLTYLESIVAALVNKPQ